MKPETPYGPWTHEPNKTHWTTRVGLPGLIARNRMGALCGYVAIKPDHPLHSVGYDEAETAYDIEVHGGLTYANTIHETVSLHPGDLWWFGFDCAQAGDFLPRLGYYSSGEPNTTDVYRDIDYVTQEVEKLAGQLAALIAGDLYIPDEAKILNDDDISDEDSEAIAQLIKEMMTKIKPTTVMPRIHMVTTRDENTDPDQA